MQKDTASGKNLSTINSFTFYNQMITIRNAVLCYHTTLFFFCTTTLGEHCIKAGFTELLSMRIWNGFIRYYQPCQFSINCIHKMGKHRIDTMDNWKYKAIIQGVRHWSILITRKIEDSITGYNIAYGF